MIAAYRWDSNWKIFLLVIILLPLLLRLGFWQLQRADEKRHILAVYEARQLQSPLAAGQVNWAGEPETLTGLPVYLEGQYDNRRHFLLDNRVQGGVAGYEVLTPVTDGQGQTWLVNRGWLPGFADRSKLPAVDTPQGELRIVGNVYVPLGETLLLDEDIWSGQWPQVIQSVAMERAAASLSVELAPYEIRIADGEPGALQVNWPAVNVSPAKHTGYAVQWFAMALALLLFWLFSSLKKVANE